MSAYSKGHKMFLQTLQPRPPNNWAPGDLQLHSELSSPSGGLSHLKAGACYVLQLAMIYWVSATYGLLVQRLWWFCKMSVQKSICYACKMLSGLLG